MQLRANDHLTRHAERKANAAFIVRAVNCHEQLVEAVSRFVKDFEGDFVLDCGEIVDDPNGRWSPLTENYRNAKAALAAVKGES